MGILSKDKNDLYEVYAVSVGTFSSQGMGATSYAKSSAKKKADALEEEYDVETAVGDVRGREFRRFSEGGSYGGEIPIYADENLTKEQVRRVVN
jgi:hypothetical protein